MPPLAAIVPLPDALSLDYLESNRILPLDLHAGRLRVAVLEPAPDHVLDDLTFLFAAPIEQRPVTEEELFDAYRKIRAASDHNGVETLDDLDAPIGFGTDGPQADLRDLANQPPVIRLVNLLIRDAAQARASDIHFDAGPEGVRVRQRIDGALVEVAPPPRALQSAVLSRLKLLGHLDIAERRVPQDGRLRIRLAEGELDLRVATIPSHFGECLSLRLLDHGARPAALDRLGMADDMRASFTDAVMAPHGIVLATGPTGSGKTTTLHAALRLRDRERERILTVEDPVEYEVRGVLQVPVNERAGMSFARALRAFLRLDPDILMVGEMRDGETTDIATRAAMTGHLVLSTLHTNDALAAIPRLLDLGAPRYLVAATLSAVLAQRLVRRICPACGGHTCDACRGTGYRGRVGVFELLRLTPELRDAIAAGADAAALRESAHASGFAPMRHDAADKVARGVTTESEVLRAVG